MNKFMVVKKIFFGGLFISSSIGLYFIIEKYLKTVKTAKEGLSYGVEGLKSIFNTIPKDVFKMGGFQKFLDNFKSTRFELVDDTFGDKKFNLFSYFQPRDFNDIIKLTSDQGVFKLIICGCPHSGKDLIFADFNDCVAKYLVENKIQAPEFFKIYEEQIKFEKSIQTALEAKFDIGFIIFAICAVSAVAGGFALCRSCYKEPPSCSLKFLKPKTSVQTPQV